MGIEYVQKDSYKTCKLNNFLVALAAAVVLVSSSFAAAGCTVTASSTTGNSASTHSLVSSNKLMKSIDTVSSQPPDKKVLKGVLC